MAELNERREQLAALYKRISEARTLQEWADAWATFEAARKAPEPPACECGADDYPRPMGARAVHSADCPKAGGEDRQVTRNVSGCRWQTP